MFNIHVEMPSGAVSRGFDRADEAEALEVFDRVVAIIKDWGDITADVVMSDEKGEIKRESAHAR